MSVQTETQKWRYEKRNEIENIIKEYNIDRTKFHETAKNYYEKVIRKLYYSFCNYKRYPHITVNYMWTKLRDNLKQTNLIIANGEKWEKYIGKIDTLIPKENPLTSYYLIVDGEWVYEGSLHEIKKVLLQYPIYMEDFYLFPKDYSWLIIYCDDGDSMLRVWK